MPNQRAKFKGATLLPQIPCSCYIRIYPMRSKKICIIVKFIFVF